MRTWTLAFLTGILCVQFFNCAANFFFAPIFLLLFGILLQKIFPRLYHLAAILFGAAWVLGYAYHLNSWTLPHESESKPLLVQGYIATIPERMPHGTTFIFEVNKFQNQAVHAFIKLSTQQANLHAGEEWRFLARLKQVHGLKNPGGFDYETWAWQNGIRATGYVVERGQNKLITENSHHYLLNRFRQKLKEKIQQNLPTSRTAPWLIALALGERENIAPENWQVLRDTGTNHLMAIAGLHIGFLASFIFFCMMRLWRCSAKLVLRFPAPHAGAIGAFIITLLYSALAGFSLPTQRACIMIATALLMVLLRRRVLSWQAWSIALLSVLIINPLSVLSESFWLSFGSVAFIIYGVSGRLKPTNFFWKVGRLQWVVTLGLIPLGIWLFQQCSFVSIIANSIAIPCVGFVIVPLTLLGCLVLLFSAKFGGFILLIADKVLGVVWNILIYLSHLSWATWYQMIPQHWILLAGCGGMLLLLMPAGMRGRWLGLIWLAPLFLYRPPTPAPGEIFFTLLDVGQGLASVVQTQHHLLVFDAGAKLSDEFDMGESVVVPFLHAIHTKKIDMLVISHGDNDHIGGTNAILKNFSVKAIKSSVPEKFSTAMATHCLQQQNWDWDGVHFEFLYPTLGNLNLNNDSSCVLKITDAQQKSVLLTGDIEKYAEKILLETEKNNLAATVLIAPHHGSKTSDVDAFIDAVHPKIVLFPVGYLNRFHFPHPEVVLKYQQKGIQEYATDKTGAIQFKKNMQPILYRI